jgi:WD40 repeat protein
MSFTDRCAQIALSADGRLIATASYEMAMYPSKEKAGPRVRLWDLSGTAPVQLASVPAHIPAQFDGAAVSSVAMSADGKLLVSGGHDRTVRVWDIADGKPVERGKALNEPAATEGK